jgi:K(+)-stimulated pyrophosphate-energized sodium pump
MDKLIYLVPAMALVGLLYMFIKFSWVSKQEAGTDRMKEISTYIAQGAMAFLRAEWKILAYFAVIVASFWDLWAAAVNLRTGRSQ